MMKAVAEHKEASPARASAPSSEDPVPSCLLMRIQREKAVREIQLRGDRRILKNKRLHMSCLWWTNTGIFINELHIILSFYSFNCFILSQAGHKLIR